MIQKPILELDIHGCTSEEAKSKIDQILLTAGTGVYKIRIIHGFNRGNRLQKMIYDEYEYFGNDKVIKLRGGENPGITELILRE